MLVLILQLTFISLVFCNDVEIYHFSEKTSKFLGFGVGVVRFENAVCTGASNLLGTCYTRRQCTRVRGVGSGRCANNIGVCCVVYRTCGETSSYNNTYFTNSNFPNPVTTATRCTMTIQKCNDDICQVRIDFLSMVLSQPTPVGVCSTDALQITGGASPIHTICGENTGQHVYVDFNGNATIQMTVTTSAATLGRYWNLLVRQIACACPTRAPIGCLMYYTSVSGTVNSFNFGYTPNAVDPNTGEPGTRELVNENYGVCIAMIPGYCGIEWSQAGADSFIVTGSTDIEFGPQIGENCTTDFVIIPNAYYPNGTAVNADRFCGTMLPTVISYTKPFVLYVVTNGNETYDNSNIGFSLNYRQIPCTTGVTNEAAG